MYHLLKLQFTYMYCSLLFYSFILPMVAKNQFSTNQKLIFFGFVGFKKARYKCIINTRTEMYSICNESTTITCTYKAHLFVWEGNLGC